MQTKNILQDMLENLKGQDIKVGAESSFVYCDFINDDIYDIFKEVDNYYLNKANKEKNKLQSFIKRFDKIWKERQNIKLKRFKNSKNKALSVSEFKEKLNIEKEETLKKCKKRLKKVNNYIDSYIPFVKRETIEYYPSIVTPQTTIIKVVGTEIGLYWDRSEYLMEKSIYNNKKQKVKE